MQPASPFWCRQQPALIAIYPSCARFPIAKPTQGRDPGLGNAGNLANVGLLGSGEPGRIAMTRLLTLVALGLAIAFAPIPGEAASKRIHVIGNVLEQTFTGDLRNPKLGDRLITSGDLFDDSGTKVGLGAGVCTTVRTKESSSYMLECLLSATFDQGQIILGGEAPFPEPNVEGRFGILGGTDAFRKARGEAILVVLSNGDIDSTFDLE
jgi:hypothetical protein